MSTTIQRAAEQERRERLERRARSFYERSPRPHGASLAPSLPQSITIYAVQPGESLLSAFLRGAVLFSGAASALYDKGREKIAGTATTQVNWMTDTIKVALVTNGYSPSLSTHEFLTDLGANTAGTAQTLTTPGNTAGVLSGDNLTWSGGAAPTTGLTVSYLAIYKSTGTAGTSPLLGLIDTATGLPLSTNGGSVSVTWSTGVNKIVKV